MLRTKSSGFTLIEMLVVIAIIAVLAAILFPVFGRAREKSRQTVCLANLGQIGAAVTMYETDYAGFLPAWCISEPLGGGPGSAAPGDPTQAVTWDDSINSYLRSTEVLKCKSNPNGSRDARAYAVAQYTQKLIITGGVQRVLGCYKDEIPSPVETVYLFEKGKQPPGAWGDALGQNVYQSTDWIWDDDHQKPFHFEGKNFLFVDGHAKFYAKGAGPFANPLPTGTRPAANEIFQSGYSNYGKIGICALAARKSKGGDWPDPK